MRKVFFPRTLDELWPLLESEPGAAIFSGGTDLFVKMRAGSADPGVLIGLERIGELRGIRREGDGVRIGACTSLKSVLEDPLVRSGLKVLETALKALGSPQIRNMGTIGGNVCTASPAGDTLPPLYVLRAEVEIRSAGSTRRAPIGEFITGPGKTLLGRGEIIAGIRVPAPQGLNLHHFEKVGQRKALAIAVASLAALMRISPEGVIEEARLAWGSVAPTVVVSVGAEEFLKGKALTLPVLEEAARIAEASFFPIDDIRATAGYRKAVAGNLLLRLCK